MQPAPSIANPRHDLTSSAPSGGPGAEGGDAAPEAGYGVSGGAPDDDPFSTRGRVTTTLADLEAECIEIAAMLERVEQGTFGICESCGEAISVERLEALPTARTCVVDELRG